MPLATSRHPFPTPFSAPTDLESSVWRCARVVNPTRPHCSRCALLYFLRPRPSCFPALCRWPTQQLQFLSFFIYNYYKITFSLSLLSFSPRISFSMLHSADIHALTRNHACTHSCAPTVGLEMWFVLHLMETNNLFLHLRSLRCDALRLLDLGLTLKSQRQAGVTTEVYSLQRIRAPRRSQHRPWQRSTALQRTLYVSPFGFGRKRRTKLKKKKN